MFFETNVSETLTLTFDSKLAPSPNFRFVAFVACSQRFQSRDPGIL